MVNEGAINRYSDWKTEEGVRTENLLDFYLSETERNEYISEKLYWETAKLGRSDAPQDTSISKKDDGYPESTALREIVAIW